MYSRLSDRKKVNNPCCRTNWPSSIFEISLIVISACLKVNAAHASSCTILFGFHALRCFAENGFKYTRFHLKCDVTKGKLEDLRAFVALWMCVPRHLISVAGVQPSNSWIITLMVPDIHTLDLPEVIQRHREWFVHRDIDRFEIDDRVINLTGKYKTEIQQSKRIARADKPPGKTQKMRTLAQRNFEFVT